MRRHATIALALMVCAALTAPAMAWGSELVVQSVNTSGFPDVSMVVAVPANLTASGRTPVFSVIENGVDVDAEVVAPAAAGMRDPIDVVLLLDASGSMAGKPLSEAKRAARDFVASMGATDRVAVVAFSERPKVLSQFTSDPAALGRAIDSVTADGETALYDALSASSKLAGESSASQRYIVLLSDGGDTVSSAGLDDVIAVLKKTGSPVYAVALASDEYNPSALKAIAKSTNGRALSVDKAEALSDIFKTIARDIQDVWSVTFTSRAPDTPDLELVLAAHRGQESARAVVLVDNPVFLAGSTAGPPAVRFGSLYAAWGWVAALLVGAATGLVVVGIGSLLKADGPAVDQLAYYHQLRKTKGGDGDATGSDPDGVRGKLFAAVSEVAGKRGFTADYKVRMERAGVRLRPDEFIYFHIAAVIIATVVARVVFGSLIAALVAAGIVAFAPPVVLRMLATRRKKRFETQLPDVISLIAGSLRAGWGIQQALDLIVGETGEPAASEFKRVQSETRLGLSLEESLAKMAERLDSDDFRWVVAAIGIQREVGGNLAEVLDIAAGTIRERAELHREVEALTAEGRFSGVVLVLLPFIMLVALNFVAPKYLSAMTGNVLGWWMLGGAGVLLVIGSIWIMRVSKVEV